MFENAKRTYKAIAVGFDAVFSGIVAKLDAPKADMSKLTNEQLILKAVLVMSRRQNLLDTETEQEIERRVEMPLNGRDQRPATDDSKKP